MNKTLTAVLLAAVLGAASACGTATSTTHSGEPGSPSTTAPSTTAPSAPGSETPKSAGEIWQWALGRNVWADSSLRPYSGSLGTTSDTDLNVQSQGFKLSFDSSGTVTEVTLFNDETAIGLPSSSSSFTAYRGSLPAGLSWQDTASTLGEQYGAQNQTGGYGTDITFTHVTGDGYEVQIAFAARHASDLPNSPIHYIAVSRP
ncbi:MAG TPA: hypothetical protein VFN97_13195 [Actinospica sp.]|nr:hypothetical protein [Actinospica sp.]